MIMVGKEELAKVRHAERRMVRHWWEYVHPKVYVLGVQSQRQKANHNKCKVVKQAELFAFITKPLHFIFRCSDQSIRATYRNHYFIGSALG